MKKFLKRAIFAVLAAGSANALLSEPAPDKLFAEGMEIAEAAKTLGEETENWNAERAALASKIESLKILNAALAGEISEAESLSAKSRELSGEIQNRLKIHGEFERRLSAFAKNSSAKFLEKSETADAKLLNFKKCSEADFKSVYAYWAWLLKYRLSVLEKSRSLGVENSGGEKSLRIGILGVFKGGGFSGAIDMLEGKKAPSLVRVKIARGAEK